MRKFHAALGMAIVVCTAVMFTPMPEAEADNAGCLGDCGNFREGARGWCGNCKSHCPGGTEAECTASCGGPPSERACLDKADQNVRDCYSNCKGNHPCEGNCGGTYKRDQIQHCHDEKKAAEDRRKGCLDACGAQKGCRNSWCDGDHPEQTKCFTDVEAAYEGCANRCGGVSKCTDAKCTLIFLTCEKEGKRILDGFCGAVNFKF